MEDIKGIISALNKEPFRKNLNLVTYDNLQGEQRIQILFDIFHAIDETVNSDILEISEGEEVVIKILEMLRILKYTPPANIEPSLFRQNLISGERNTFTHIFNYLLSKLDELKQRAYLARFLVKIEVSPDVEGDQDIVQLYEQYEQLIENFKMVHSTNQNLKKSLSSIQELQRDIKSMEDEKEQIQEKLVSIKRKVDVNQDPAFFRLVQTYREEKDKNENLMKQMRSQDIELEMINEKIGKVKSRLKAALVHHSMGITPEDILEKLEEEVEAKKRLVKEVLPLECDSIERYLNDIEDLSSQPEMLPNVAEKVKAKIQSLNREINEMIEKKMLTNDDTEDEKLALVRQSASLVAKKRANLQETVKEASNQLEEINDKLGEKRMMFDGEEILQGEDLKRFVTDVRNKGSVYKQKRRELAEIRTKSDILMRTDEILKEKWNRLGQILLAMEEQRGIVGYFTSQNETEKQREADEDDEQNTEELRGIINDLNESINSKKAQLAPLVKDLRPLRQQCQELQMDCDRKKSKYDSLAVTLETNAVKLESLVKKYRHEFNSLSASKFTLEMEIEVLNVVQSLVDLELRYYVANAVEDKEKSWLAKLEKDIINEEEVRSDLRTRMRELQDNENNAKKQSKMWQDLKELLKVKNECFERRKEIIHHQPPQGRKDHLIL